MPIWLFVRRTIKRQDKSSKSRVLCHKTTKNIVLHTFCILATEMYRAFAFATPRKSFAL